MHRHAAWFLALPLVMMLMAFAVPMAATENADAIVGTWLTSDKKAKVAVARTAAGTYEGTICWISDPLDATGTARHDTENPDAKLRAKPLVGLTILSGATFDKKSTWDDGTIYDPQSGSSYSCTVKLESPTVLKLHGYIGISLLGRTERWSKVEDAAASPAPPPAVTSSPAAVTAPTVTP